MIRELYDDKPPSREADFNRGFTPRIDQPITGEVKPQCWCGHQGTSQIRGVWYCGIHAMTATSDG